MASLQLHICVLLHAIFFLSYQLHSNEEEDNLLQGINSYRQSLNLPILTKNGNADCLADAIANRFEDRACNTVDYTATQFNNYPNQLSKCNVDIRTTKDGVILPVCVPKLVPTLVLTNYTQSQYTRYLNDSKFTGAGIGSEDDWTVLVLSTNTPGGIFENGSSSIFKDGLGYCLVYFLLGFVVHVVN